MPTPYTYTELMRRSKHELADKVLELYAVSAARERQAVNMTKYLAKLRAMIPTHLVGYRLNVSLERLVKEYDGLCMRYVGAVGPGSDKVQGST